MIFVSYAINTIILQLFNGLHIVVLQQRRYLHKKIKMTHETHVISRHILMMKCVDQKQYVFCPFAHSRAGIRKDSKYILKSKILLKLCNSYLTPVKIS